MVLLAMGKAIQRIERLLESLYILIRRVTDCYQCLSGHNPSPNKLVIQIISITSGFLIML